MGNKLSILYKLSYANLTSRGKLIQKKVIELNK